MKKYRQVSLATLAESRVQSHPAINDHRVGLKYKSLATVFILLFPPPF